ncbi:Internalin-A precursor [Novipirellula galeiformis]|uniref:Internalin-A n=2 Tax=Novipirellula galeiformis TaxID=2528004 RepID=A0A5C6C0X1_9BACT|nr:Internalin-A precursor [Novipirellula galeiformis]
MQVERRPRLRYSIASLLLLFPLVAIAMVFIRTRQGIASEQRNAVAWIESQNVGLIRYDSQPSENGYVDPRMADPGIVGRLIGAEYVQSIEEINIYDPGLTDLSPIGDQVQIKIAMINTNAELDISALSKLKKLESLQLSAKEIDSLAPLYKLENLTRVMLVDTNVSDAEMSAFKDARPDIQFESLISQ